MADRGYYQGEGNSKSSSYYSQDIRSTRNMTQSELYEQLMTSCNPEGNNNHSYSQEQINQYRANQSDPRFFVIDSIDSDGVDVNLNRSTPDYLAAPVALRPTNLSTPSTMTPLFSSVRNSVDSAAFTNDTDHATIGPNRSESHIN